MKNEEENLFLTKKTKKRTTHMNRKKILLLHNEFK